MNDIVAQVRECGCGKCASAAADEIERLHATMKHCADWIERVYGGLPVDRPPGPPTQIIEMLRHAPVQSAECCRGLAPKWQCRCEIERPQATIDALYEWYDRDGSVGGASEVFERHRAADPKSPPREHLWFRPKGLRWDCCEVCGIVRRMDGEPNQPCRGPVSVGPRADPQSAKTQKDPASPKAGGGGAVTS